MKLNNIISISSRPPLYEKGTSFMWTDEHISAQILKIHLDPDIDLGSRKQSTILRTARWILDQKPGKDHLNILDLGCGPGLYTEIFAEEGHHASGVDISESSIAYARQSAREKRLDIEYIHASYLDFEPEAGKYDMVIMIYTDLGVLNPEERDELLTKVERALGPDGMFIFDVLHDNDLEQKLSPKSWEAVEAGFWKKTPYLALSESTLYKDEKVILYQHHIIDTDQNIETYRFWTHFFNRDDIKVIMERKGFGNIRYADDVIPGGDLWGGNNVLFTVAMKNQKQ